MILRRCLTCVLLLTTAASAAAADRPASGTPDARFAPLDRAIIDFADRIDAGAATVAVNIDGKLVYARGFGWSDQARTKPVQVDALMRVASVSKPVTAAMVRDLFRQNKLAPDTPAFAYLGLQPPAGAKPDPRLAKITVGHLLQHKGGWDRDAAFDPMFRVADVEKTLGLKSPATPTDVIRYMLGQPLQFDPGQKSAYSNFGYCVLGRVIEKATGKTYAEALKAAITDPLQISDQLKIGRTSSRQRDAKEVYYPVKDDAFSLDVMDAHGGIIASAPALCRYMQAYWISGLPRKQGANGQSWVFFGSLPGTTSMVLQMPGGIDVAVLLNNRRRNFNDDSGVLRKSVEEALAGVK